MKQGPHTLKRSQLLAGIHDCQQGCPLDNANCPSWPGARGLPNKEDVLFPAPEWTLKGGCRMEIHQRPGGKKMSSALCQQKFHWLTQHAIFFLPLTLLPFRITEALHIWPAGSRIDNYYHSTYPLVYRSRQYYQSKLLLTLK